MNKTVSPKITALVLGILVVFSFCFAKEAKAATETLRPNIAGDETNLASYPDPPNWAQVDEASPDDASTDVHHNSSWQRDLYNLPAHTGIGSINFIKVYVRGREGSSSAGQAKIAIKTGGTAYESSVIDFSEDWTTYSNQWTNNPKTTVAWTWTDIDALQIGVALRDLYGEGKVTRCTQVYVVVAYTSVVALTVTTQACTSVEATTATGNGNITATGGATVTRRGFCYMVGTSGDPTTANSVAYSDGSFGTGAYTKAITGLSPGTSYRVRAYAVNSAGTGYGTTIQILTKPAAPTGVAATDGTYTDKVVVTWTKSTGATGYQVYRDSTALGWLDDVATYGDTGAAAPTITPGAASASDGTSAEYVALSLSGQSTSNGTTHTYKVRARNATGESADSSTNTGYRGVGSLTYQWQRSAADSDANYSNISGATTASYNDTGAPSDGSGRYYKCVENASGAAQQTSTADRGYRMPPPPCQAHNISGYAWSENIGWISFSCKNTGAPGDYGVDINASAGNFSGYVWSENIGWINFAPAGPYPTSPNYSVCLDLPGSGQACDGVGNYQVSGWARVLSYGGGWDGWIKLKGTNYGVSISSATGEFSGYVWSDMVIGWISFKGVNYMVKTSLSFNQPPDKPSTFETDWNRCAFAGGAIPTLSWTYSDPDGNPQAAYEIEVDDNSSFNAPKFNHLVNAAATSYVLDLRQDDEDPDDLPSSMQDYQLDWNSTYFWRVRVKDSFGNWSSWSNSSQSKTDKHASPQVIFTFTPAEPIQKETVEFDPDETEVFGGTGISSYLWTITQGTGVFVDETGPNSHYPNIQFLTFDNRIKLEVTDTDGYTCESDEKTVIAQLPMPEYQEIPPIIWLRKTIAAVISFWNTL